jgi:two-component system, cell cycle sensor histidine kinase and response regulator CckA
MLMQPIAIEPGQIPLDAFPDPHIVLDSAGGLLAASHTFDRRLLSEPRALLHLATVGQSPVVLAAAHEGHRYVYEASWTSCRWAGTEARLVRLLDVTEERAHVEHLERHVQSLDEVLDALPASLLILDGDGRILSGNARWHISARANGLLIDDAGIGSSYLDVCDRSAANGDYEAAAVGEGLRSVLSRKALAFEMEYRLPGTGEEQWYRLSVNALSGHAGAVIQHFDTTESHREQQERLEALAHFKAVFDGALDGIVMYDDNLRVLRTNAAVNTLMAAPEGHAGNYTLTDLIVPEDHAALHEQHATLLRDGAGRGVLRLRRADNTVVEVEYASRANIVPGRHVAIARDMTASRQLELQLRQAQKMEALGQLTGGIAHDFNNILTVILAHADLLLSDEHISPDVADGLTEMLRASQRGADMVRKLMAFGRREQLRVESTHIDTVMREVSGILKRILPETIVVHCQVEGDMPAVLADATAVQQILLNLATNARDAMRDGGGELRIVVHTVSGAARTGAGVPRGVHPLRHVVVTVTDTGVGMSPETLARIFEPFFTTKGVGEGTGLGMSMVYGLMEQMGGRVSIQSGMGAGTTVHLHFPIDADQRPIADVPAAAVSGGHGNEHILLVEDDDAIRMLSARVLRRAGYAVTEAVNGNDAAALLRRHAESDAAPFDMVVSDVVMPHGDGSRVLEAARQFAAQSRIVWVTGYAGGSYVDQHVHAPCDAPIIQKPWTTGDFLARIRGVLDGPPNVPSDLSVTNEHSRAG